MLEGILLGALVNNN